MKKTFLIRFGTLALLVVTVLATNIHGEETASFRRVPIPQSDHGYSNFKSTVITSQSELDMFLRKGSKAQNQEWEGRADFEKALAQAKVDFDRESLVLLQHFQESSSVQIDFRQPRLEARRLICPIDRNSPVLQTTDLAYHCFALAVVKADVATVEMQVSGKKPIILSITKGDASNPVPEDTDRKLADPQR